MIAGIKVGRLFSKDQFTVRNYSGLIQKYTEKEVVEKLNYLAELKEKNNELYQELASVEFKMTDMEKKLKYLEAPERTLLIWRAGFSVPDEYKIKGEWEYYGEEMTTFSDMDGFIVAFKSELIERIEIRK